MMMTWCALGVRFSSEAHYTGSHNIFLEKVDDRVHTEKIDVWPDDWAVSLRLRDARSEFSPKFD
jgi:hypothetical protein